MPRTIFIFFNIKGSIKQFFIPNNSFRKIFIKNHFFYFRAIVFHFIGNIIVASFLLRNDDFLKVFID